jgi:uncharacterized iron-regulated protein
MRRDMRNCALKCEPKLLLVRGASVMALCLVIAAADGCSGAALLAPPAGFSLRLGREHPLTGRIYASAQHEFVGRERLRTALAGARFALLGEIHDNPDQHQLQATLLADFAAAHHPSAVAFEMLDETQAPALADVQGQPPETIAERVHWNESGWPEFAIYRPIFVAAHALDMKLVAALPSHTHVHESMTDVSASEASSLHLDQPFPQREEAAQRDEIRASHCGYAPDAMATAMLHAQHYKDAFMARALLAVGVPTALITGREHARKDRGVPLFLERFGTHAVISVGLIDVDDHKRAPSDYDIAAFDFVVFTPRVSDEDPCVQFRKGLEQMRRTPSAPATGEVQQKQEHVDEVEVKP